MRESLLESIGYYFWFIPSIISVILSSSLVIFHLFNFKTLRVVGILEVIFGLADLLQCIPWFFGSIYSTTEDRSNDRLCLIQEGMFKVGILVKCLLSTLGVGALTYHATTKTKLHFFTLLKPSLVLIIYVTITLLFSLFFHADNAVCDNLHHFDIYHIQPREVAYMVCFMVPVCIFCFLNVFFFLYALYHHTHDLISAIMIQYYDRITLFTTLSFIAYLPSLLFFFCFLVRNVNIVLYCIMALTISCTGIFASGYLLFAPYIDKTRRTNIFFFVEKLIEENMGFDSSQQSISSRPTDQSQLQLNPFYEEDSFSHNSHNTNGNNSNNNNNKKENHHRHTEALKF